MSSFLLAPGAGLGILVSPRLRDFGLAIALTASFLAGCGDDPEGSCDHAQHGHAVVDGQIVHDTPAHCESGAWPPWPNYYEEHPEECRYMLYDPTKWQPHSGDHGAHGHGSADPYDCRANPPTHAQIRAANQIAVDACMFVRRFPIFENRDQADAILAAEYETPLRFTVPGLEFLWDLDGWHYIYWPGSADPTMADGSKPENIIYLQTDGGFRPVGVMFTSGDQPGPDFGGCLSMWHNHGENDGTGALGASLGYMMHVWTWGAPGGAFHEDENCGGLNRRPCIDAVGEVLPGGHPDRR